MLSSVPRAVVDGLLEGSVYGLMAAGLTLIVGVMTIINIAQGAFVVLGAYLSYALALHLGLNLFVGLLVTTPVMFLVGLLVHWAVIRRLQPREIAVMSVVATFAVALIIQGSLTSFFGANFVQLHAWYVTRSIEVANIYIPYIYLFGAALAVTLMLALYLLLYRTNFGAATRAMMQNRTGARLIGIDVDRVSTLCFAVGVAVTAAGGMVFGAINTFSPNSGNDLISRLLTIIVLGGMGSMAGAFGAALLMLVLEDVVSVVWSPTWAAVVFFVALAAVLMVRPTGLLGRGTAVA